MGGYEYLPEFNLDFSSFTDSLLMCISGCGIFLILAQITAHFKHPASALFYMAVAISFSFLILET